MLQSVPSMLNDELDDERSYVAAGADGSIGKAVKGGVPEVLSKLGQLWHARWLLRRWLLRRQLRHRYHNR